MKDCGCAEDRELKRYKSLAASLPLHKGTIIDGDGNRVDISEIFGIPVSISDPQLAKAQNTNPYIRDEVLLEDGRTFSLLSLLYSIAEQLHEAGLVYTEELRLDKVPLEESDWEESKAPIEGTPNIDELNPRYYKLKGRDWNGN